MTTYAAHLIIQDLHIELTVGHTTLATKKGHSGLYFSAPIISPQLFIRIRHISPEVSVSVVIRQTHEGDGG